MILKIDNTQFIICNVYGHNNNCLNTCMFEKLSWILFDLKSKYRDEHVPIGGDFNEVLDDALDRFPLRNSVSMNCQLFCDNLQVIDAWRFLHPHNKEYNWNNNAFTQIKD